MPIIALILANLPTIISAGEAGWKFITSVRAAAQQSGDWTAEAEAAFQALLVSESVDAAWATTAAPVAAPVAPVIVEAVAAAQVITEALAPVTPPPVTPPPVTPPPVVAAINPAQCQVCGLVTVTNAATNCNCSPA